MEKEIYIRKKFGKKKPAVRINKVEDIPEELRKAIKIVDDMIELDCTEGDELVPLGSVIGYEYSPNTESGINTWKIDNVDNLFLIEENGEFFTNDTINKAVMIGEELPDFLEEENITRNEDGSWTLKTDWGESTGYPGEGYFVLYGTKDHGKSNVNILTNSEPSFDEYYVCDADGNIIDGLSNWTLEHYGKESVDDILNK